MLKDLMAEGFGEKEDLNCAEKILRGANMVYKLGLDDNALKLAAGFGSGMAIGDKCGALTACIMVLGRLFVNNNAHESAKVRELTRELFRRYGNEMGSIDCAPLRRSHRTKELQCRSIIVKAAEILDDIIESGTREQV